MPPLPVTPPARVVAVLAALTGLVAAAPVPAQLLTGRELAHSQERGNCLACHRMPADTGAQTEADMGPVLEHMRERFPDRQRLRQRIWDARAFNPDTIMPPYGRHRILTEEEIDRVVDYIHGL